MEQPFTSETARMTIQEKLPQHDASEKPTSTEQALF
jgi:hypothetical protein